MLRRNTTGNRNPVRRRLLQESRRELKVGPNEGSGSRNSRTNLRATRKGNAVTLCDYQDTEIKGQNEANLKSQIPSLGNLVKDNATFWD